MLAHLEQISICYRLLKQCFCDGHFIFPDRAPDSSFGDPTCPDWISSSRVLERFLVAASAEPRNTRTLRQMPVSADLVLYIVRNQKGGDVLRTIDPPAPTHCPDRTGSSSSR